MANLVEVTIRGDDATAPAFTSVTARAMALKALLKNIGSIGLDVDQSKIGTALSALKSRIQSLGIADLADVNVPSGKIYSQLQFLKRAIQQAGISDLLDVNVNRSQLAAQLGIVDEMVKSQHITDILDVNVNQGQLSAMLARVQAEADALHPIVDIGVIGNVPVMGPTQKISDKFEIQGLALAEEQLAATREQTNKLSESFANLETAKDSLSGDIDSKLTPAVTRARAGFGGWGGLLAGSIGGIGLWHVALDATLESVIALASGLAALTVGVATMIPTAQDIYTHLKAVSNVNSVLGSQIPPLTGQFDALATAMAPQTIEAYGGALNLLSHNTGILGIVAHEVVTGIDDMIAKLDLWNSSQKRTGQVLQNGVGFLHQFEGILGNISLAISHLVRSDPGTAHYLLDIVGAAAKLLNVVTSIPAPLLKAALGLHSLYLWGNVASGALGRIVGLIPGLSRVANLLSNGFSFGALANPMVAGALLAAAAVFEIVISWNKASQAASDYVGNLDTQLSRMSASDSIVGISQDIGKLNEQIQGAFSQSSLARINAGWNSLGNTGRSFSADLKAEGHDWAAFWDTLGGTNYGKTASTFGKAIAGIFVPGQGASEVASNNVALYKAEIDKLVGSQKNLLTQAGLLTRQGYSLSESFAILDLAGVQLSDSLPLMGQKVANLIKGYQEMSVSGGLLSASVNAVTFASLQQSSKVDQLNSAWDAFITTVSGGESAFSTFAQQASGMYAALVQGGAKLSDSNGRVSSSISGLATSANGAKGSLTGLNSTSLNLRQSFIQSVSAANSQMDALTTLASAAGLGTQGTDMLMQANKDLVAVLLPAAKDSTAMTAILYALAQRGGYTGADSFKALAKWVGNTKDPMKSLDGIVTTLTVDAGNLTQDVQNLSTALGTTLNDAMSQVILTETGGLKPMENLYNAIKTTGLNSVTTKNSAFDLAKQFLSLTGNVTSAKGEFETFAISALGLTKSQADVLWQKTLPDLQNAVNSLHGTTIPIGMKASGTGKITAEQTITGGTQQVIGNLLFVKAGGKIPGFGGGDILPAMLEPGETVIDKYKTQKYAKILGAWGVRGFSGGGLVGMQGADAHWTQAVGQQFEVGVGTAYASALHAELIKAIINAITNLGTGTGPGSGSSLGSGGSGTVAQEQAYAMTQFAQYGWSPSQINPLDALWMQESGWNPYAVNPSSGAYGIPQALPAAWGHPYPLGQYIPQINWGLAYIAGRYGSPASAEGHELAYHWYDNGGWLKPGLTMAYNGTGQSERVLPPGSSGTATLEVIGGQSDFERFMAQFIREFVRLKGGGDVQRAFGSRGKKS